MAGLLAAAPAFGDNASVTTVSTQPLRVVLFYSPSCDGCQQIKENVLPRMKRTHGERIVIEKHNIDNIEIYRELLAYEKHYESEENETLKVFLGSRCLAGAKGIATGIAKGIEAELASGALTFKFEKPDRPSSAGEEDSTDVPAEIKSRFRTFSPAAVAVAGLIDGINPCAFATIVFLISLLSYLGKSRREILTIGIGFTASVFITYLALGMGAFKAIKTFCVSNHISRAVTYVAALCAFGLAAWSLWDYVRYKRTGNTKDISLKLPKSIRLRMHKMMRMNLSARNLFLGAVTTGFLVAILESLCTGQVYLPTIVFVMRDERLRPHAFGYLSLYNLMFILPLVAIMALGYWGMSSERLGRFLRARLGLLKIAMAACFLILGLVLVFVV